MPDTRFLEELASAAPTPGGGGAAAFAGALGAALGTMVGNLTVGKKKYAQVEEAVKERMAQLDACREELVALVAADAEAFSVLAATWKMPKDTPEEAAARHRATQAALIQACEVPLQIMRVCERVIEADEYLARHGSSAALSDVGASAALAKGAAEAAVLNVYINAAAMDDAQAASELVRQSWQMTEDVGRRAAEVYEVVRQAITRNEH